MSPGLRTAVVSWWERSASGALATGGFAQIDIDQLLDDPPPLAVAAALEAVQIGLELSQAIEPAIIGLVTVPLEPSESVVTDSPDLESLLTTSWPYGPGQQVPGVYLLSPRLLEETLVEDFRLDVTGTGQLPAGFSAYYRCWRTPEDAARGWEYDRTIYVHSAERG